MVLTVPGDVAEPGVGQRNVDTALERIDTVNTLPSFRACIRTALGAKPSPLTTPPNHAA